MATVIERPQVATPWQGEGDTQNPPVVAPPPSAAPTPTPYGQVAANLLPEAVAGWRTASEARNQAVLDKATAMEPQITAAQRAQTDFAAENEKRTADLTANRPNLSPPPSLAPRPFLASGENEAPLQTIGKFIQALSLFAQGIGGVAMGDARGSLAAMKGALEGWQVGDRDRVVRDLTEWKEKTAALEKNWQMERQSYEDWFKAKGLTVEQMLQGLRLESLKHDNPIAYKSLVAGDFKDFLGFLAGRSDQFDKMSVESQKIMAALAQSMQKELPAEVRAELQGQEERGEKPSVTRAIEAIEKRKDTRSMNQGLNAAAIPARTPEKAMENIEATTQARMYIREMQRLIPGVRLDKLVGGINPWITNVIQTGKAGPIPVPNDLLPQLSDTERRFLALLPDYADTLLRMRSGAAINNQEYERMFRFVPTENIGPQSLLARLKLSDDLAAAKMETLRSTLQGGGYRAPAVATPGLGTEPVPNVLSRKSAEYKRARSLGITDAEMKTKGLELSD